MTSPTTSLGPIARTKLQAASNITCSHKSIFTMSILSARRRKLPARRQKAGNDKTVSWLPSSQQHPAAQNGGVDRDRTDDLKLAKLALSQLSYDPVQSPATNSPKRLHAQNQLPKPQSNMEWWARVELNHRPHAYQACALTT